MDTKNPRTGQSAGASKSTAADVRSLTQNCPEKQPQVPPSAPGNVLTFTPAPRPLRADVPPFDPNNPAHLRAWESMWDLGQWEARNGK